ncbi:hypothetical protein QTP88_028010 [Uroleucon formosanum]
MKNVGPDGLSGEYLYQLKNVIAFPLWTLFKRSLEEGIFPSMLKFNAVLYCALIRPIVEYGAAIWESHDINDSLRLERVQRKFMRYACIRLNIPCEPHNYGPVASQLGLVSLAERRRIAGIKFLKVCCKYDDHIISSQYESYIPQITSELNKPNRTTIVIVDGKDKFLNIKNSKLYLSFEHVQKDDNPVIGRLKQALKKKNLKVNIVFLAIYKRGTNEENMEYKECNFKTQNSNLSNFYTNTKIKIVNEIEDFVMKNSQWRLHQILSSGININKYVPFKGSSYIPLPEHIQNKHAIINVKNKDDKCFLWAILSALHHVEKDGQKVTKYIPFENEFDNELKEITKIEKTNHIDLLYLTVDDKDIDDENNMNKGHYCWIKDLWKLCGSQMTKDGHKRFLCKMCLNSFDTENKLNDHKHYCANNKAANIVLPESYNKILEFEKYNNSLRAPFIIYADFEATLQPIYTCKPSDKEAFTNCYQKHIPNNFCYYIKYSNSNYKPPVEYSGPNVAQEFYECMKDEEKAISKIYDKIVPMETLNAEQLNKHNKSDKCHICERYLLELPPILEKKFKIIKGVIEYYKQFKIVEDDDVKKLKLYEDKLKNEIENKNKNMQKVRDHDHLTGEYRGAAHSICNLNYQNPHFIPIVFHNLSGYDAHLFIKEFGNDDKQIKLIPNNEEKYISFSKMMPRVVTRKGKGKDKKDKEIVIFIELRFIDSFKFLPSL